MATMLWMVIKNHLPVSIAAIFVALLSAGLLVVKHQNVNLREQVELCAQQKMALAISNTALLASLREQNTSLKVLESTAKRKAALAREAMKLAHKRAGHYRTKALAIRDARPGGDECRQMKELLMLY